MRRHKGTDLRSAARTFQFAHDGIIADASAFVTIAFGGDFPSSALADRVQLVNASVYSSYRTLKTTLGEFDGLVEFTELALREIELQSAASGDVSAMIQALSGKHGIAVNYKQFPRARWFHAVNAVAVTHNSFQIFLDDFRRESTKFLSLSAWDFDSKLGSRLEQVLRHLPCDYQSAVKAVGAKRKELAEYYHLVRNHFVHAHGDEGNKVTRQYRRIADDIEELRGVYKVKTAPNSYENLQFEDVIMFSRLAKDIASSLCLAAQPTDEQLASAIDLNHTKSMIGSPRLKQALMMFLATEFGLGAVDSDRIANILYGRLKNSPLA